MCKDAFQASQYTSHIPEIGVLSQTLQAPQEHCTRHNAVFDKLWTAGLELNPSKCELGRKQINYLAI